MYDTWGDFALLCKKYLVICNLPKISQNRPGLKDLNGTMGGGGVKLFNVQCINNPLVSHFACLTIKDDSKPQTLSQQQLTSHEFSVMSQGHGDRGT